MSILGNIKLTKREERIVVGIAEDGSEVALVMRPPRLGFVEDMSSRIPEPSPPAAKGPDGRPIVELDSKGKRLLDGSGSPVIRRNYSDPKYLTALSRRETAMTISLIVVCIDHDGNPGLSLPERDEDEETLVDYYKRTWSEFEDAGLDVGAFQALSQAALKLGQPMTAADVEDAKKTLQIDKASQAAIRAELSEDGVKNVPEGNSESV